MDIVLNQELVTELDVPSVVSVASFFGAHGSTFWPNMSQDLAAQTKSFPEQLDPLNLYTFCLTTLASS